MPLILLNQRHFSFTASENLLALHEFGQHAEQREPILGANQLPNGMHTELGHANIQRGYM